MKSLRIALSATAALLIGVLGPGLSMAFGGINNSKATGIAVIRAYLLESFFTPWFWVLSISSFALFYGCSRLGSKPLRIILFWTPVSAVSTLGISILALFTYLWIHFP